MLSKAYGVEAMKKSSASEWHKQFKDLLENVEGDSGNALISMVFFTFNSFHKTKL